MIFQSTKKRTGYSLNVWFIFQIIKKMSPSQIKFREQQTKARAHTHTHKCASKSSLSTFRFDWIFNNYQIEWHFPIKDVKKAIKIEEKGIWWKTGEKTRPCLDRQSTSKHTFFFTWPAGQSNINESEGNTRCGCCYFGATRCHCRIISIERCSWSLCYCCLVSIVN